jgi:signal transduction histidine kinase
MSVRLPPAPVQAEIIAAVWEVFSALLFISGVVPAAFATPWPALILLGSLALSAVLAPKLLALGARGYGIAGLIRMLSWPLAVAPLLGISGSRVLVAALPFGMMAGGMRRAIYRRMLDAPSAELDDEALQKSLRSRLSEAAMVAGILGGHVMLLFSVAFLRTQSQLIFQAWIEIVPALALLGTAGFSLAIRPATRTLLRAIAAGPAGDRSVLTRGLAEGLALPSVLAYLNFGVWLACTAIGIVRIRPGPASFRPGDAVMQLAYGSLFAWGVAFYQRAWHRDALAPAVERLRRWTGTSASVEPGTLRRRMLRSFGLPLLFTAALSLLSSIGLYRALGSELSFQEDFNAISALFASFAILVIAVGGVLARAARDLSVPMTQLARAADQVAHGQLDAAVPRVTGPVEVIVLGESIERMRQGLANTIAELSKERAGLEANVEARTAELRHALDELRRTQAALIQGERLATIGELVAGVAHEIYNPLNAIAGAAVPLADLVADIQEVLAAYQEMEREVLPERRKAIEELRARVDLAGSLDDLRGISTVIKRATERSVRIVQNLRNFSRGSGEPVPTDIHAGLEETLVLLGPRLRQAGIKVLRRLGEIPQVVCQAGEMNQIFMNLLVNAVQALEQSPGGAVRDFGEPMIVIETWLEADLVAVSITDNGPGVPAALAQRVFDPFFTTKPRGQGTGLGLSISTDIARRHGGSVSLEHPGGGGARFICRIPVGKRPSASRVGVQEGGC